MKKVFMKKVAIVSVISIILCLTAYFSKEQDNSVAELAFSNIEALAAGESGGAFCYGNGSIYCNGGYYKDEYTR